MFKLLILWLTASPKSRAAALSVLKGTHHARLRPAKKGERGFRMEEGGER